MTVTNRRGKSFFYRGWHKLVYVRFILEELKCHDFDDDFGDDACIPSTFSFRLRHRPARTDRLGFRVRRRELLLASLCWGSFAHFSHRLRLHELGAVQHLEHRIRSVLLPLYHHRNSPDGCRAGVAEDVICKGERRMAMSPWSGKNIAHIHVFPGNLNTSDEVASAGQSLFGMVSAVLKFERLITRTFPTVLLPTHNPRTVGTTSANHDKKDHYPILFLRRTVERRAMGHYFREYHHWLGVIMLIL